MIDIIQTPKQDQVFLNTAPINIIVNSILGAGYYFKMLINVNDEFYDEQVRAKVNDTRCEIDFKGTVSEIFNQEYTKPTTNGIVFNSQLLKKVDITIIEIEESTGVTVNGIDLPTFYLLNANQENNLVYNKLQLLSIYSHHIKMPKNGIVSIPFFNVKETIVKLYINYQLEDSFTQTDCFGVYNANILLEQYNLSESDDVKIVLFDGDTEISLPVVIYEVLPYDINKLVLQNNYNAWEIFYCFGEQKNSNTIDRKTISLDEKRVKNYQNITKPIYEISTGDYHQNYVDTIAYVIDSQFLYVNLDNELIEVTVKNTKTEPSKTKVYFYNTSLNLENNHKPNLNNAVQYVTPPSLGNIEVNGLENVNTEILKEAFLNKYGGVNPLYITFPVVTSIATLSIVVNGTTTHVNTATKYVLADFEKVIISGSGFGSPYDTFKYNIENIDGKSNTATATINVLMDNPLNQPPVISLATTSNVYIYDSSKSITASITDPENEQFSVIWEQISGPSITLTNVTKETLTVNNWATFGSYVFKITATDVRGASSYKTTTLTVKPDLAATYVGGFINVVGGVPGDRIKIDFTVNTFTPKTTFEDGGDANLLFENIIFSNVRDQDGGEPRGSNKTAEIINETLYFYLDHNGERSFSISQENTRGGSDAITSWVEVLKYNLAISSVVNSFSTPINFILDYV